MNRKERGKRDWAIYYDNKDILSEIAHDPVDLSLDDHLRQDILSGKRSRKLKNITIKIDPLLIIAIKKLATMRSMPYQTLIRNWLSEEVKKELDMVRYGR